MPERSDYRYEVFVSFADGDRDWVEGYLLPALSLPQGRVIASQLTGGSESFHLGADVVDEFERGRDVRIRRIPGGQRLRHTALDFNRDSRSGHQLLIIKDSASGALRLYEPEITASGQHCDGLAADGSNLASYFGDQPKFGIYHYIEIIGKLQPGLSASKTARP